MSWLRSVWKWIVAVGAFIIGIFIVGRNDKWQERAVSNEEDDVQDDLDTAEKANQQAKVHDEAAHEIKEAAQKPTEKKPTSDILKRWRK